ncbi:MAG: phosphatidylglycerophosphatase A [Sphingobacteriales bacterium]|nr:MAG: phosphatidylglycerophosphatase A [Sphingobacteriales bacterium]
MRTHKIITTTFGIGYISRGGGTVAAIFLVLCWYAVGVALPQNYMAQLALTLFITLLGIWSAGKVEAEWGKDSSKVVIDEVAGMCVSLLFLPVTWQVCLVSLILFRFFDILKPLFIRKTENLPGGWGVMMDDVLSGVYANIIASTLIFFKVL